MERMNNVLEKQFQKQNSSLERNLKTHVNEGYQKHLGSLRNAQGSFAKASGGVDMGFEKRQLIGHR